ncbi:MAG: OmpH family outer membrane protein [Rhodospirillales bacterium]|nr:OmpH family outer membrane protein [Rhodospirillales bacterium]
MNASLSPASRLRSAPSRLAVGLLAAPLLAGLLALPAQAQSAKPDYFIPGHPAAHTAPARPARPAPVAADAAPGIGQAPQPMKVSLPPAPEVPPIPHGSSPPAAIIGVISVPDVMHASTAYETVDKELAVRRQKLNEDAQKEQATLRKLGDQLAAQRAHLTPEQLRQREQDLQNRIAESRRKFGERNQLIQEDGQYALAQIERTLSTVVQAVAASHGMNLVLHRQQVALNVADFDLTPQVSEVLNKVLPAVVLPPEGVSPEKMPVPKSEPDAPAAAKKPAAAPHK